MSSESTTPTVIKNETENSPIQDGSSKPHLQKEDGVQSHDSEQDENDDKGDDEWVEPKRNTSLSRNEIISTLVGNYKHNGHRNHRGIHHKSSSTTQRVKRKVFIPIK